jgi:hypothetical protein
MSVLYGRCDEESLEPYQPFAEALHDLLARAPDVREHPAVAPHVGKLARMLPGFGQVTPTVGEGGRHRLFEAVAALMDAVGRPLLFVLDDLHWADAPTLLMLRSALRRARVPLVVLATSRDAADVGGRDATTRWSASGSAASMPRPPRSWSPCAATRHRIRISCAARTRAPRKSVLHRATGAGGADVRVPAGVKELIAQGVARLPRAAAETV